MQQYSLFSFLITCVFQTTGLKQIYLYLTSESVFRIKEATNNLSKEKVIVKVVSLEEIDLEDIDWLKREIEILKKIRHRNIIGFIELFENTEEIHIVMEG